MKNKKLWGGRFQAETHADVDEFLASVQVDQALAQDDITGSIAHAAMLAHCGIITQEEYDILQNGLLAVKKDIDAGEAKFTIADEDVHMNIERMLTEKVGEVAGKLHTARSRNDQVALDVHLYLRREVLTIIDLLNQLRSVLIQKAAEHEQVILPGYTHLQRAQPIRLAHHFLAYAAMFERDAIRLKNNWAQINISPLGAAALAGSSFKTDPAYTAKLLGFDGTYANSLDAVSDRDFMVEFLSCASLIMMHLSRFSEELILWSSQEFAFIQLDDAYCTGSSIMPQKKNPDVPELMRGKTGRVYGDLISLLTTLKGLPLAYNKDMQEDKEPLFDAVKTVKASLAIFAPLIETLKINADKMQKAVKDGFLNATDLADDLAKAGMPFREAHRVSGEMVAHCIQKNCY
ncbi:MAG: argH, partial [Gammaproteobacteria bacterium]|nr:argH [Gammaproteobacteria bacterium]